MNILGISNYKSNTVDFRGSYKKPSNKSLENSNKATIDRTDFLNTRNYFISPKISFSGVNHSKEKTSPKNEKIINSKKINNIDLDYISDAHIDYNYIDNFLNKTLVVDLKKPMHIISTSEGPRTARTIGNHFVPPEYWERLNEFKELKTKIHSITNRPEKTSSFLFTGANMDNLSIKKESFKDLTVYALVTAGVKSNAVRMSRDEGKYYEPGTINVIILTNTKLSPEAMTRAIIDVTEAKTAAVQDLDIRSSEQPELQATGTGTDSIIVAEGDGIRIDETGGHSKMGELIAKAVYAGVKEAVYKQNGIENPRSILNRLADRKITLSDSLNINGQKNINKQQMVSSLENLLLKPRYASFVETAFATSDAEERGLIGNLDAFEFCCKQITGEISGQKADDLIDFIDDKNMPKALKMAFNALLNGIYLKNMNK